MVFRTENADCQANRRGGWWVDRVVNRGADRADRADSVDRSCVEYRRGISISISQHQHQHEH